MTLELLTAIVAFAFVSSITPGPNNLMLLASGVNYGFKRSIPHMLGIAVGTSKAQLHRARRLLAQQLQEQGFEA